MLLTPPLISELARFALRPNPAIPSMKPSSAHAHDRTALITRSGRSPKQDLDAWAAV
jgi:hypothetical protein